MESSSIFPEPKEHGGCWLDQQVRDPACCDVKGVMELYSCLTLDFTEKPMAEAIIVVCPQAIPTTDVLVSGSQMVQQRKQPASSIPAGVLHILEKRQLLQLCLIC